MQTLPDFDELHTFTVAARFLNLTRAAAELHVTQGAVSQRIKQLETRLGGPLFQRLGRELQLTTMGHEVRAKADILLAQRAALFHPDATAASPMTVILNTTPSLARGWLLPRLPALAESYPDLRIRVLCSLAFTRFRESTPEIALRYGAGNWPQTEARPFLQDWLYPVYSPRLDPARLPKDGDWSHCPLLEDIHAPWRKWFAERGVGRLQVLCGFNDAAVMLDAVERGYGIGLMRHRVVSSAIAEGRLVRLGEDRIDLDMMHWIVTPEADTLNDAARRARERVIGWLMDAARDEAV